MRSLPLLAVLLAIASLPATPLHAQEPAALHLVVVQGSSGEPIANAQVVLRQGRGGLTDRQGAVLLAGLPAGAVAGEVRYLGYKVQRFSVPVLAGDTMSLTVPLEAEPIALDPVEVEATSRMPEVRSRELREFYPRVRTGTGQYITRADIAKRRPRDLSDLLGNLPGIRMMPAAGGEKLMMEAKGSAIGDLANPEARDCPIQYFLDGTPIKPIHGGVLGAEVSLGEIEGVEIYRRGSTVVPKFHRMHNSCGVILIWKKEKV